MSHEDGKGTKMKENENLAASASDAFRDRLAADHKLFGVASVSGSGSAVVIDLDDGCLADKATEPEGRCFYAVPGKSEGTHKASKVSLDDVIGRVLADAAGSDERYLMISTFAESLDDLDDEYIGGLDTTFCRPASSSDKAVLLFYLENSDAFDDEFSPAVHQVGDKGFFSSRDLEKEFGVDFEAELAEMFDTLLNQQEQKNLKPKLERLLNDLELTGGL